MTEDSFEVQEKVLEPVLVAGIRMQGKYGECGKAFGRIGRKFGFRVCGKPMMLIYDQEYRQEDADFEPCMPVRSGSSAGEIHVRELAGGRAVTLLHRGPYDELGQSYAKLLSYVEEHGYTAQTPCREIYHKGPGMIFRGNPKMYLTELQMLVASASGN